MAVLRQLALLPGKARWSSIALLHDVVEVRQATRRFGNLPTVVFARLRNGEWLRIHSASLDVHFKFECIGLAIERTSEPALPEYQCHSLEPSHARLLFRADWLKPIEDDVSFAEWKRVAADLTAVNPVPSTKLSGCLSLWGVLFCSGFSDCMVSLDEFPLSLRVTNLQADVDAARDSSCVVPPEDVGEWIHRLSGWEMRYI